MRIGQASHPGPSAAAHLDDPDFDIIEQDFVSQSSPLPQDIQESALPHSNQTMSGPQSVDLGPHGLELEPVDLTINLHNDSASAPALGSPMWLGDMGFEDHQLAWWRQAEGKGYDPPLPAFPGGGHRGRRWPEPCCGGHTEDRGWVVVGEE